MYQKGRGRLRVESPRSKKCGRSSPTWQPFRRDSSQVPQTYRFDAAFLTELCTWQEQPSLSHKWRCRAFLGVQAATRDSAAAETHHLQHPQSTDGTVCHCSAIVPQKSGPFGDLRALSEATEAAGHRTLYRPQECPPPPGLRSVGVARDLWSGLLLSRGGEGGRGFWTQNLVYQKWPDQIFPIVNFVFSHYGHFGLGRGGGGFGGGVRPPPWFLIILEKPCLWSRPAIMARPTRRFGCPSGPGPVLQQRAFGPI